MYMQTEFDQDFLRQRVKQFRAQVERRIDGSLTEDEFKPLRLMNGLYLQLHAYMLRVAIPYGTLNAGQMRQLAMIADRWDRGYGLANGIYFVRISIGEFQAVQKVVLTK